MRDYLRESQNGGVGQASSTTEQVNRPTNQPTSQKAKNDPVVCSIGIINNARNGYDT